MHFESYSPFLIILSIIMSVISSYAALLLVERIAAPNRSRKIIWAFSGSLIMGLGIFAMHFVGMLAYHIGQPMAYDSTLLVAALLVSIISSFVAFYMLCIQSLTKIKVIASGIGIGIGIVLTHYTAMAAITNAGEIHYDPFYITLSIVISLVFSSMALMVFFKIKEFRTSSSRKIVGAVMLGLSVSIMHYTGMKAAVYIPQLSDHPSDGVHTFAMAIIISSIILILIGVSIFMAFVDHRALNNERKLTKKIKESEAQFRSLVELSPDAIAVYDGKEVVFVNEAAVKLMDVSTKSELLGTSIFDCIPSASKKNVKGRIERILNGFQEPFKEQQLITPSGSLRDVEVTGAKIEFQGKPAIQLMLREITEQKRMKRELEESEEKYRSLFDHNQDAVLELDMHGIYRNANQKAEELTHYSKEELSSISFSSLLAGDSEEIQQDFLKVLEGESICIEQKFMDKLGHLKEVDVNAVPIRNHGEVSGAFAIVRDVTETKRIQQKVKELAFIDHLTGLPNRHSFYENLKDVVLRAEEQQQPIAVLLVDFDDFKEVNDQLGHHGGDLFLQKVSERFRNCLRENDKVFRHGGDEFIIVLENIDEDEVKQLAERIITEMNQPLSLFDHEVIATLSIGISIQSNGVFDDETIIRHADLAMYSAKEKGKNNYQFFTESLNKKATRKLRLGNALRKAVEQKEFQLYYQPQVELQTGNLVGLEALIRWNSPFGLVSPAEFIPLAEETGLVLPIGEWVIDEACRQIKIWEQEGRPEVKVSVNASARQFRDRDFAGKVKKNLEEAKVDPRLFEIEITESVMLNIEESSRIIQELKALGVKVAIDDFGAGYSSLNVIKNVEIDTLKIDKSLIDEVIDNSRNMSILDAIINVGKNLKTEIIVEGIEDEEQLEILKPYNIIGQGYYFSRPCLPEQLRHHWDKVH